MKNKIKKNLIYAILSIVILNGIPNNVCADSSAISLREEEIETYAEKVSWYYRTVNGRAQKRLWSRTYGHWITDWIWV